MTRRKEVNIIISKQRAGVEVEIEISGAGKSRVMINNSGRERRKDIEREESLGSLIMRERRRGRNRLDCLNYGL